MKAWAEVSTGSPKELTLKWLVQKNHYLDELGVVRDDEYVIKRKSVGESTWTTVVPNATEDLPVSKQSGGMMSWTDPDVEAGEAFEYTIERQTSSGEVQAVGYLYAGIDVPLVDDRGTLLLAVDDRITTPLATEIARLKQDLVGDGWKVEQIDAHWEDPNNPGIEDTGVAVSAVKQAIKDKYAASAAGPFGRITTNGPVVGLSHNDSAGATGNVYMVRAVTLETTPSGTYYNASQGAFSPPVP